MQKNCFWIIFGFLFACCHPVFGQDGPPNDEKEYQRQYQERIKKDRLFGVYIPKNLDDALLQLDKLIPPKKQAELLLMPEDSVCKKLHNSLGRRIMDNWGFAGGSRLSHYLKSAGVTFPDDMADFILVSYHRKLNGKPINLKEQATYYREKRHKEHEAELKKGKVIKEEKKKKPAKE